MVIGAAWNGARAFTATSGPGVSLMQEFLGLAYFAEIPVVLFDVQRGSPSTGHADAHAAGRPALLRLRVARRHQARDAAARGPDASASTFGAQAFDLADRLQTPIFVMLDLDIGMQDWLTEPFAWDDAARMDRGKVMTAADLDAGATSAATSTSTATASRIARIRARIRPRAATSRAARPRTATRATRRRARRTSTTCSGCCASSRPRSRWCRCPSITQGDASRRTSGVIWFGSTGAAMAESLAALELDGIHLDRLRAARRSRSTTRSPTSSPAHDRVFVVEQNRDAQMKIAARQRMRHRPGDGSSRCCTTTARRSPRASSRSEIAEKARLVQRDAVAAHEVAADDLSRRSRRSTIPSLPQQRARLHASRLRRRDLDAVRRLRPRLDLRRDHPGVLRARRARRIASPSCRASAARRRRRPISSATRTASTACTAACRRC